MNCGNNIFTDCKGTDNKSAKTNVLDYTSFPFLGLVLQKCIQ